MVHLRSAVSKQAVKKKILSSFSGLSSLSASPSVYCLHTNQKLLAQWSVSPCPAVMYGSDLWAGGNRKRRHVGNQTAVYGGRGHEPGSDKSASVKYTSVENNSKTSDTVFISHCLDVYLSVRRGRQRRMGKKNYAMCFVLCRLWDEA